jgi:hypothetical protein
MIFWVFQLENLATFASLFLELSWLVWSDGGLYKSGWESSHLCTKDRCIYKSFL